MAKRKKSPDYMLLFIVIALLIIGLMMVYASTFYMGYEGYGQPTYFLLKQLVWAAIGLVGLAAMARIDYHHWQRFSVLIIAVALLLLIAVLF
ncbi:MAG: FtsW/RodA/SpoVE family cell cycle protein, partial [Chloroflexota bacterium]|nr:FtsW/RodA/SpoVE family cell cycle protein [Chloroflexota bacterium]